MASIVIPSDRAVRLSGEFDYLNESGSTFYYGEFATVSSGSNLGSVTVGNSLSRRAPSWVISAGTSNLTQKDPSATTQPSAVPTGGVETQDIQDGAVTPTKLGLTKTTYTQTYSTAAATVPAATAAAVATDAAIDTGAFGYAEAQANAIPVAINANEADILALKKVVNQIIDDLQLNNAAA